MATAPQLPDPAPRTGRAVQLIGDLLQVGGPSLTHEWDANSYLLLGDEPTLFDCSSTLGYPQLELNLAGLDVAPGGVRRVIATHSHWDHLSGVGPLQAAGPSELWIHALEVEPVEQGDPELTASFLYDEQFPALRVDRALTGGEQLQVGGREVLAVHTPGHSPGGMSYLFETAGRRVLIAGDTLWGGFHVRIGSDMDAWVESLDRLVELEPDVMTVGHGPVGLIFDATTKLREARQQLGVYFNPWFKPFNLDFRY